MVDEEILDPSALSSILVTQTDLQLRELEVQRQIQLEKLRLEQEERIRVEQLEREERKLEREERMQREKLEMEERIQKEKLEQAEKEKERQYNLRMKELEMQDKVKTKPLDLGTHFWCYQTHPTRSSISRKRSWQIFSTLWKSCWKFEMAKRALDLASAERCDRHSSWNLYPVISWTEFRLWQSKRTYS